MAGRVVYFNGEYVPETEARVSIFDSALMFGDMAFEMTRTFNHQPFRLREHLDRLYASLRLIETDPGMSIDEMERISVETLQKNLLTEDEDVDWQIMHDVSRGPLGTYESAFPGGIQPTVSINCWPLILHQGNASKWYEEGVRAVIPAQHALPAHLVDSKAKTRSRLHYQMAQLQVARMQQPAWPVLLDTDGFLAEGTGNNVFLVKDSVLLTPEPRNILLGVSRGAVLDLADNLGIQVRETNLDRYNALLADEMFFTSTTICMVHAASFEGQQIGDGRPGPVYRRILEAWKEWVGVDFVEQARKYVDRMVEWQEADRAANAAAAATVMSDA